MESDECIGYGSGVIDPCSMTEEVTRTDSVSSLVYADLSHRSTLLRMDNGSGMTSVTVWMRPGGSVRIILCVDVGAQIVLVDIASFRARLDHRWLDGARRNLGLEGRRRSCVRWNQTHGQTIR